MAIKISSVYVGDGQVELAHEPSKGKILTDLPADNGGKGRTFSPTDLVAAALSSCILTIMAKAAERDKIDLTGAKLEIEKHMSDKPRRVGKLVGTVTLPAHLTQNSKDKLAAFIKACPVHQSLHPQTVIDIKVQ
ncbi:MAG: OsmC family protein [Elusimicrobia bacterium]|nr:OsmC family protein [Elusimicrobiota bacterium]